MANPSGKTYHYGEHDPIAEPGGLRIVYKEEPRDVGRPAPSGEGGSPRRLGESRPAGSAPGTIADVVGRYPILCLLAAVGCGFVVASLCPSGFRR